MSKRIKNSRVIFQKVIILVLLIALSSAVMVGLSGCAGAVIVGPQPAIIYDDEGCPIGPGLEGGM